MTCGAVWSLDWHRHKKPLPLLARAVVQTSKSIGFAPTYYLAIDNSDSQRRSKRLFFSVIVAGYLGKNLWQKKQKKHPTKRTVMSRNFIVMGDTTSHGGTVISADVTMLMNNKNVARVGDLVVCRKCRGTFAINSGATDMTDGDGRAYARHGDTTECGAYLISGQQGLSTWKNSSTLGDPAAADKADALASAADIAAPMTAGVCLDCLRKAAQLGSAIVIRE